ncbi:hypothetical protein M8C21_021442, partial [Ambrosia artemisiifolia]
GFCMAPSRRRGVSKAAATAAACRKWKVGDLVLAKMKGFPAWPATVSEPEKWGYSTDWKKVLVFFFGTQQIAFCNPADVEAFTEEKKLSLLNKRHGKGADFVRAVKEIIASYEELKKQEQTANTSNIIGQNVSTNGVKSEECVTSSVSKDEAVTPTIDSCPKSSDSLKPSEGAVLKTEDEKIISEGHNGNLLVKEEPLPTTYSRKKFLGTRVPSARRSRSFVRAESCRFQTEGVVNNGNVTSVSRDGSQRRTKRVRTSPCSSDGAGSNASPDENGSRIVAAGSDTKSLNDGNCVQSGYSKLMENECDMQLSQTLKFQNKAVIFKKKRKPSRKRDFPDKIEPIQNSDIEQSVGKHSKEGGDEHLPLVKRARVRMGQTSEPANKLGQDCIALSDGEDQDRGREEFDPCLTSNKCSFNRPPLWEVNKNKQSGCMVDGEAALPPFKRLHRALEAMSANVAEDKQVSLGGPSTMKTIFNGTLEGKETDEICGNLSSPIKQNDLIVEINMCSQTAYVAEDKQVSLGGQSTIKTIFSGALESKETDEICGSLSSPVEPNVMINEANTCSEPSIVAEDELDCLGGPSTMKTIISGTLESKEKDVICSNLSSRVEQNEMIDKVNMCSQPAKVAEDKQASLGEPSTMKIIINGTLESKETDEVCGISSSRVEQNEMIDEVNTCSLPSNVAEDKQVFLGEPYIMKTIVNGFNGTLESKETYENHSNFASPVEQHVDEANPCGQPANVAEDKKVCLDEPSTIKTFINGTLESKVTDEICSNLCPPGDQNEMIDELNTCSQPSRSSSSPEQKPMEIDDCKYSVMLDSSTKVAESVGCPQSPITVVEVITCGQPSSLEVIEASKKDLSDVCASGVSSDPVSSNLENGVVSHDDDVVMAVTPIEDNGNDNAILEDTEGTKKSNMKVNASLSLDVSKALTTVDPGIEHSHLTLNSEDNTSQKSASGTRTPSSLTDPFDSTDVSRASPPNNTSTCHITSKPDNGNLPVNSDCCSPNVHEKPKYTGNKWNTISEANAALASFEASLGALTRTKKSIDRATRIAIDAAKFGIAVKVLKVWQERKILPEPMIRHHIRELESLNMMSSRLGNSRRAFRNERAFDDPVREVEGMLVDEYGSNSSIQLSGFCIPTMLKDEKEGSDSDAEGFEAVTPEHDPEICEEHNKVPTPATEKHTHVLEDVDGELEMEDVAPTHEGEVTNCNDDPQISTGPSVPYHSSEVPELSSSSSYSIPCPPVQAANNVHLRPPHPAPSSQFSYFQSDQPCREIPPPSYPGRYHFVNSTDTGPCHPDGPRGPYPPNMYAGPPCEPPMSWHYPARPPNHRDMAPHRPYPEASVHMAPRGPNFWRPSHVMLNIE